MFLQASLIVTMGRRDGMVVRFATTCAISELWVRIPLMARSSKTDVLDSNVKLLAIYAMKTVTIEQADNQCPWMVKVNKEEIIQITVPQHCHQCLFWVQLDLDCFPYCYKLSDLTKFFYFKILFATKSKQC
jgi:hypothetical protein